MEAVNVISMSFAKADKPIDLKLFADFSFMLTDGRVFHGVLLVDTIGEERMLLRDADLPKNVQEQCWSLCMGYLAGVLYNGRVLNAFKEGRGNGYHS